MDKNKKLLVWLPLIIAISISVGILVGNYFLRVDASRVRYGGGNKLDAVLSIINRQYVDTVDVNMLIEHSVTNLMAELDPHSVYIAKEDVETANQDLEGSFSGIGVQFNMQTDTIIIVSIISGGPAEKAGLMPFDRIITINDSVFAGKKIHQNEVMKTLRGAKESTVKLGIERGRSDELMTFEVTRGDVPNYSIGVHYKITDKIGYIKVDKFSRTTFNEFITAIASLKQDNIESFVIDLRGNSGGIMESAVHMINEFLPEGQMIVYSEGKAFPRYEVHANGTGTCQTAPMVVLVDEFSGSASEIFAGAIQDNDRGMIVGRRTFGKGLIQSPFSLYDGSELRLTIARYYTPSGRSIQKKYEMGKNDDYARDIYDRYMHGEFYSVDSLKIADSLEYKTSIGRTVYGGGGITPDIFIPRDTSGVTSYYTSIVNSNVLYQYALHYSDIYHEQLSEFKTYEELYEHLKQQPILYLFTDYAAGKGIRKRPFLINISGKLIESQLHAYIVRNFFDNEGFYPIFLKDDKTIRKAVDLLENDTWKPSYGGELVSKDFSAGRFGQAFYVDPLYAV